jgi:imidazolonepropionase
MTSLFLHAAQLLTLRGPARARRGPELRELGLVRDGAVLTKGSLIVAAGTTDEVTKPLRSRKQAPITEVDCSGKLIAPGFVDSHTHVVFPAPRLDDYERRLSGATYEELARSGGGIRSTVERLRSSTGKELLTLARRWLCEAAAHGSTTIEIKSGYGFELKHELRMLRAAKAAAPRTGVEVVRTFLGAHTIPSEYESKRRAFVSLIIEQMLPQIAKQRAAEFCDVFCDRSAFTVDEARSVLEAARTHGLKLKLHADQLTRTGATRLGVELGATSVDHLDCTNEGDWKALAGSDTIATLLPASNFFLGTPYPQARAMIEAGVAVALATDFNPGTSPTISMPLVMAIACSQMRMSPAEAWVAATINGAAALARADACGSIEPGKRADLAVFAVDDFRAVPYFAGMNLCEMTVCAGRRCRTGYTGS